MAPIDIDPLTGAPVMREDKPVSDFVASVQEHIDSEKSNETEQKVEGIPATGPGNPAPQHNHLIENARAFNTSIGNPSPPAPIIPQKKEELPTSPTPAKMTTHATSGVRTPSARERVAMNPGPVHVRISPSLMSQIRGILKDNGMDSQQQEQALQRIGELLQNYKS